MNRVGVNCDCRQVSCVTFQAARFSCDCDHQRCAPRVPASPPRHWFSFWVGTPRTSSWSAQGKPHFSNHISRNFVTGHLIVTSQPQVLKRQHQRILVKHRRAPLKFTSSQIIQRAWPHWQWSQGSFLLLSNSW